MNPLSNGVEVELQDDARSIGIIEGRLAFSPELHFSHRGLANLEWPRARRPIFLGFTWSAYRIGSLADAKMRKSLGWLFVLLFYYKKCCRGLHVYRPTGQSKSHNRKLRGIYTCTALALLDQHWDGIGVAIHWCRGVGVVLKLQRKICASLLKLQEKVCTSPWHNQ
jgi:hypothetical protein